MLTRMMVKETADRMPKRFTIDQLVDQLVFIEKVKTGLQQSAEGRIFSRDKAKNRLKKWFQ